MLVELTNRLSVMKEQFHARIDYLVNCGKMFLTPKALSKQEKKNVWQPNMIVDIVLSGQSYG